MSHFLRVLLFLIILTSTVSCSRDTSPSTTTLSILRKTAENLLKLEDDFKREQQQLQVDRDKFEKEKKQSQVSVQSSDVIRLIVGGEVMMTTRETLTRVPKSILGMMFNGRWENELKVDLKGNIFLDFNPLVFRHLLDQLQTFDVNKSNVFFPPSQSSLVVPFKKMLQKLAFDQPSLEKTIVTVNVGGQIHTNRLKQLTNTSTVNIISSSEKTTIGSDRDIFLDHDPKLYEHLIDRLRGGQSIARSYCNALTHEEKVSFKRLLVDLNISPQIIPLIRINTNTTWIENGVTVAGRNGNGSLFNQLSRPQAVYVHEADDGKSLYIADLGNHRIVEWKHCAKSGEVVAGGNGWGNRTDQLTYPTDVFVDKKSDSLIICDYGNRRVVQWPRRNATHGKTLISDIDCNRLTTDSNGDLYVSNWKKNEVRRWKMGDTNTCGTIVAGGNGEGHHRNQFNAPSFLFVDRDFSVYVSDWRNHRVMKWLKGAKEGIVVAGGHDSGDSLTQLSYPQGIFVDDSDNLYVADGNNNRVMRWLKGSKEGSIAAGNGVSQQSPQCVQPFGISFDREGNLYVVDYENNRIQTFHMNLK